MKVYNDKNYATVNEVASTLGVGDKTVRNRIKTGAMPPPSEYDDAANRSYFSSEYIVEQVSDKVRHQAEAHRQSFLDKVVGRVKGSLSLDGDFKTAILTGLQSCFPEASIL